MFSLFAGIAAVYATKTLSDTAASKTALSEEKPLLSKHKEIIEPLPQPTKDNPFINQVTKLLAIKKFDIAHEIIALELKKETNFQDVGKIIRLIDQMKKQISECQQGCSLSLFDQQLIVAKLNKLRQDAVTKRREQVALSRNAPIPSLAPMPTPPPRLSCQYGATQR